MEFSDKNYRSIDKDYRLLDKDRWVTLSTLSNSSILAERLNAIKEIDEQLSEAHHEERHEPGHEQEDSFKSIQMSLIDFDSEDAIDHIFKERDTSFDTHKSLMYLNENVTKQLMEEYYYSPLRKSKQLQFKNPVTSKDYTKYEIENISDSIYASGKNDLQRKWSVATKSWQTTMSSTGDIQGNFVKSSLDMILPWKYIGLDIPGIFSYDTLNAFLGIIFTQISGISEASQIQSFLQRQEPENLIPPLFEQLKYLYKHITQKTNEDDEYEYILPESEKQNLQHEDMWKDIGAKRGSGKSDKTIELHDKIVSIIRRISSWIEYITSYMEKTTETLRKKNIKGEIFFKFQEAVLVSLDQFKSYFEHAIATHLGLEKKDNWSTVLKVKETPNRSKLRNKKRKNKKTYTLINGPASILDYSKATKNLPLAEDGSTVDVDKLLKILINSKSSSYLRGDGSIIYLGGLSIVKEVGMESLAFLKSYYKDSARNKLDLYKYCEGLLQRIQEGLYYKEVINMRNFIINELGKIESMREIGTSDITVLQTYTLLGDRYFTYLKVYKEALIEMFLVENTLLTKTKEVIKNIEYMKVLQSRREIASIKAIHNKYLAEFFKSITLSEFINLREAAMSGRNMYGNKLPYDKYYSEERYEQLKDIFEINDRNIKELENNNKFKEGIGNKVISVLSGKDKISIDFKLNIKKLLETQSENDNKKISNRVDQINNTASSFTNVNKKNFNLINNQLRDFQNSNNKKLRELANKITNGDLSNNLTRAEQENINKALSNSFSGLAAVSAPELEMMQKDKEKELVKLPEKKANMISIKDIYNNDGLMNNKNLVELVRTRKFWSELKHYFKGLTIFIPFVRPGLLRDSHGLFDIFQAALEGKIIKKYIISGNSINLTYLSKKLRARGLIICAGTQSELNEPQQWRCMLSEKISILTKLNEGDLRVHILNMFLLQSNYNKSTPTIWQASSNTKLSIVRWCRFNVVDEYKRCPIIISNEIISNKIREFMNKFSK